MIFKDAWPILTSEQTTLTWADMMDKPFRLSTALKTYVALYLQHTLQNNKPNNVGLLRDVKISMSC